MVGLASRGSVMSSICLGSIMASALESENEAEILQNLCDNFIAFPDRAEEISLWFLLSTGTFSPEARAVNLADNGFTGLSYAILVNDLGMVHEDAMRLSLSGPNMAGLLEE